MGKSFSNRWWVVAASVCGLVVGTGPINTFAFGVFLKPVTAGTRYRPRCAWLGIGGRLHTDHDRYRHSRLAARSLGHPARHDPRPAHLCRHGRAAGDADDRIRCGSISCSASTGSPSPARPRCPTAMWSRNGSIASAASPLAWRWPASVSGSPSCPSSQLS